MYCTWPSKAVFDEGNAEWDNKQALHECIVCLEGSGCSPAAISELVLYCKIYLFTVSVCIIILAGTFSRQGL